MSNERHRTKFRADRSNRCQDMAVCLCFKMVAVRHPGFLKVQNFNRRTLQSTNMRHRDKFHADRSRDRGSFQNLGRQVEARGPNFEARRAEY